MAFIILGIIILIVGAVLARGNENVKRFSAAIRIIGFIVVLLGVMTACFIQIEAGFVGVKKLFGKVQNDVLGSGLHFVNPLLDVEKMDIKTENYTMSGVHDEGGKS